MTQFVLLVLREGEPPRCVGPFALQRSAESLVELEKLREGEYLIQPMESPTARHRLIPSPVPRDVLCLACGKPFLPTHSIAAPGPTSRHPFRTAHGYWPSGPIPSPLSSEGRAVAAGALADWEERKREVGADPVNFTARHQWPDLAAGGRPITSWIEGHAGELRRFVPQELPEPPKEIEP